MFYNEDFFAFSNTVVMTVTFLIAYSNDYKTIININRFGEAHVELVFVFVVFVLSLFGLYFFVKNFTVD